MIKHSLLHHIKSGLHFNIPVCCVLRWSLENFFGVGPIARKRLEESGIDPKECCGSDYVPCMIFHNWKDAKLRTRRYKYDGQRKETSG